MVINEVDFPVVVGAIGTVIDPIKIKNIWIQLGLEFEKKTALLGAVGIFFFFLRKSFFFLHRLLKK